MIQKLKKKLLSFLIVGKIADAIGMVVAVFVISVGVIAFTTPETDLRDTVVMVSDESGHGSGVIVAENGLILTARHVVEGTGESPKITLRDGREYVGKVLWASSADLDLALIQIDERGLAFAEIRQTPIEVGADVTLIGHPLNDRWVTTYGKVANDVLKRASVSAPSAPAMLTLDITGAPGNSGGGAFDEDGRLVGITSMMMVMSTGSMLGGIAPVPLIYVVSSRVVCTLLMCN